MANLLPAFGGITVDDYWRLSELRLDYIERFGKAMDAAEGGPLDLLLGPASPLPAFTHGAAKELGVPGIYVTVSNLSGQPAGVVPVTRVKPGEESDLPASRDLAEKTARKVEAGSAGLPMGVQVIGRHWQDHVVLAGLAAIETGVRASSSFPATPIFPA